MLTTRLTELQKECVSCCREPVMATRYNTAQLTHNGPMSGFRDVSEFVEKYAVDFPNLEVKLDRGETLLTDPTRPGPDHP